MILWAFSGVDSMKDTGKRLVANARKSSLEIETKLSTEEGFSSSPRNFVRVSALSMYVGNGG